MRTTIDTHELSTNDRSRRMAGLFASVMLMSLGACATAADPADSDGLGDGKSDSADDSNGSIQPIDVEQEIFASPISANVFVPARDQQVSMISALYGSPEAQAVITDLAQQSSARQAALTVMTYGAFHSVSGRQIRGEVHLGEYTVATGKSVPVATLLMKKYFDAPDTVYTSLVPVTDPNASDPALDVEQHRLGSPVSANVFLINREDQRAMMAELYGSPAAQDVLTPMIADARSRSAALVVISAGAVGSRTGDELRGEIHLGEYSVVEGTRPAATVLFEKNGAGAAVDVTVLTAE